MKHPGYSINGRPGLHPPLLSDSGCSQQSPSAEAVVASLRLGWKGLPPGEQRYCSNDDTYLVFFPTFIDIFTFFQSRYPMYIYIYHIYVIYISHISHISHVFHISPWFLSSQYSMAIFFLRPLPGWLSAPEPWSQHSRPKRARTLPGTGKLHGICLSKVIRISGDLKIYGIYDWFMGDWDGLSLIFGIYEDWNILKR